MRVRRTSYSSSAKLNVRRQLKTSIITQGKLFSIWIFCQAKSLFKCEGKIYFRHERARKVSLPLNVPEEVSREGTQTKRGKNKSYGMN